jgi:hypothetical protein
VDLFYETELLGFWTFPSSGILGNRAHDVSETGSVTVFRWERKANFNHWNSDWD